MKMEILIIKRIISIITYWLLFNILIILCDLNINTNSLGLNQTNENLFAQYGYHFDSNRVINVTALENESVVLKCLVKNKGNKTISWIRKSDLHILTSENFVFSGDSRFTVLHDENSDEWNLKIDHVKVNDSGNYECQLNTQPKMTLLIHLEITVPEVFQERMIASANSFDGKVKFAKIFGSSEVHVKIGSTIALTCMVNHQVPSILWYHNSQIIEFNSNRGGINLEIEKSADGTTSRLLLTRAQFQDSGNYSCVPLGAIPASCIVHVLNGEHPAAKYTSGADNKVSSVSSKYLIVLLLVCNYCTARTLRKYLVNIR